MAAFRSLLTWLTIFVMLAFGVALFVGIVLFAVADTPKDRPDSICGRCGTEFWSYDDKGRPINRDKVEILDGCPNCPLSEEDFERLKRELLEGKE